MAVDEVLASLQDWVHDEALVKTGATMGATPQYRLQSLSN